MTNNKFDSSRKYSSDLGLNVKQSDLSLGQKELWYINAMGKDAQSAYNESFVYQLKGHVDLQVLSLSINAIVARHEALRTSFAKNEDGHLIQCVHPEIAIEITRVEDIDHANLSAYLVAEARKPFDLEHAPLLRVSLLKMAENEHILVLVLHHVIMDGTSMGVLVNDLNASYNQMLRHAPLTLSPPASYLAHIDLEQKMQKTPEYQTQVREMADALKGYSALNFLTTPLGHEQLDLFSGDRVHFDLEESMCAKIHAYATEHRVTPFHVLYAAFCVFLSKYTRSQDIVIGVPFANREHDPEKEVVGYFVNTLPLRVPILEADTFVSLTSRVRTTVFKGLCRQHVSFEHVANHLQLSRKLLGQHPILQTMFVWGHTTSLQLQLDGVDATLLNSKGSKTSKFDLSLFMMGETKDKISGYFEYRTALFDEAIVKQMSRLFMVALEQCLNAPHTLLSACSLLSEGEKNRMKSQFFTSKLDGIVTQSLGARFSKTANGFASRTGLIFGKNHYDYATIERVSNQWASYIRHQYESIHGTPIQSDTLIALCVDRSEDMIFGMLGILKAGAAYVPVDPKYPLDRMNYILTHSKASLLLTHKVHHALNLEFDLSRVIDMDDATIKQSPHFIDRPFTHQIDPKSIAYVLYTSGSTGKPKGVGVTHDNVICLFDSLEKQFDMTCQDIWSLFHTFCFDISVWEIWGAFLYGGALLVIPYEVTRDASQFYELIKNEKVTVLTQTASAFQLFINEDAKSKQTLEHLRYVGFVGESLKVSILRPWVEKYGTQQPRLANLYGITETTVYTNYKFVEQIDIDKGRDNIGWPLEAFSMCVMDEHFRWCPVGIVGEICIGGRGLSRGYLYRDDLTQEKFVQDPYAGFLGIAPDALLYKTGDLGRFMDDGSIEYLGRKDFQIKLRGFRVELGEIEATLGSYSGVSHTVVLLKGEGDSAYLSAYFTTKSNVGVDMASIIAHLKSFLPEYMVPSRITKLPSFPMTVNGKIDRLALHALVDNIREETPPVPLTSMIEFEIAQIWSDVLNVKLDDLGKTSNFFELGGNSLLVIKMLTLLSRKVDKEIPLSQFIGVPTIGTLSMLLETEFDASLSVRALRKTLQDKRVLDASILPLSAINPNLHTPQVILLTGATGFLGSHVLLSLLQSTDAVIYCLVRASSINEARALIINKLEKYKLTGYQAVVDRIKPVLGDLSQLKLGLSAADYEQLCYEVDSIFHVGARVHHVLDYHTLYQANVGSVYELLCMATAVKNKAIHFVSTLATELISPIDQLDGVDPESFTAHLNTNGYLTTKWLAECWLNQASERGILAYVYRPGNIVAGELGVYEAETNHTLLRLKGMLQLKKGFLHQHDRLEMMPVDVLANAMVEIAKSPARFSYNLNNAKTVSWIDYLQHAKTHGFAFDLLDDEEEWYQLMSDLSEENALYALSHVYKKRTREGSSKTIAPDYVIETPHYDDMIELQFKSLISSGFLETF